MEKRITTEDFVTNDRMKRAELKIEETEKGLEYVRGNVIDGALKDIRGDLQELKVADNKIARRLEDLTVAITEIKHIENRVCIIERAIPNLLTVERYEKEKDTVYKGKHLNLTVVSVILGTVVAIAGIIVGGLL
jgi:hypothetical protein